jgi:hypothetical protein
VAFLSLLLRNRLVRNACVTDCRKLKTAKLAGWLPSNGQMFVEKRNKI